MTFIHLLIILVNFSNGMSQTEKNDIVEIMAFKSCSEDSYFRVCFSLNEFDCKQKIKLFSQNCLKDKFKLPLERTPTSEAYEYGRCVGELFEKKMATEKSMDLKCESSESWE